MIGASSVNATSVSSGARPTRHGSNFHDQNAYHGKERNTTAARDQPDKTSATAKRKSTASATMTSGASSAAKSAGGRGSSQQIQTATVASTSKGTPGGPARSALGAACNGNQPAEQLSSSSKGARKGSSTGGASHHSSSAIKPPQAAATNSDRPGPGSKGATGFASSLVKRAAADSRQSDPDASRSTTSTAVGKVRRSSSSDALTHHPAMQRTSALGAAGSAVSSVQVSATSKTASIITALKRKADALQGPAACAESAASGPETKRIYGVLATLASAQVQILENQQRIEHALSIGINISGV